MIGFPWKLFVFLLLPFLLLLFFLVSLFLPVKRKALANSIGAKTGLLKTTVLLSGPGS